MATHRSIIYNQDCIQGSLQHIKDETVDLGIYDPPFGIDEKSFDKHYNRKKENVIQGYEPAPDDYLQFTELWITEAKRILKPNGTIYIISGWTNLLDILNVIEKLNLILINHIIWKYSFGVFTRKKFVSSHYHILYVKKGKLSKPVFNTYCRFGPNEKKDGRSLLNSDLEDVWVINKEYRPGEEKNINKLPDELIKKMVLYSSNPGDVVCDFFLGNFTTALNAFTLGRKVRGFELNKNAFDLGIKKLSGIKFGSELKKTKEVEIDLPSNQYKAFTESEKESIAKFYNRLVNEGTKEHEIRILLQQKFGRGKFSIKNVLDLLRKGGYLVASPVDMDLFLRN